MAATSAPVGADAPVMEVMRTMRSMRRLKPDPVPDELLMSLVEAATWGPSGGNQQAYSYVVVTDRGQMARLAELWRVVCDFYLESFGRAMPAHMSEEEFDRLKRAVLYQRDHFEDTPAVIVPCYDLGDWQKRVAAEWRRVAGALAGLGPRRAASFLLGNLNGTDRLASSSVYPGIENLLIAARAHGLGATLTTWHLFLEPEFKEVLGIPRRVRTFAIVPVGWPKGRFGPVRRRPVEEVVHRDRW